MKAKKGEANAAPPVHGPARPMTSTPGPVERLRRALNLSKDASLETILREAAEDIESRPLSPLNAERKYDKDRFIVLKTDVIRNTDASKPV